MTKTRGERERPPARPASEGVYAIVGHRNHTHLAYVLELPSQPGEVQQALKIAEEATYIVSVRNPKAAAPTGTGLDKAHRAIFPKGLEKNFRSRRFIPLDPPDFLDHEGAEIVLVGRPPSGRRRPARPQARPAARDGGCSGDLHRPPAREIPAPHRAPPGRKVGIARPGPFANWSC